MNTHLVSTFIILMSAFALATTAEAQHSHHQHGSATSRHCQTDYDHRPHYYHSGTHYHYCPGGGHQPDGGHSHGGRNYASNYDPMVVEIQRVLAVGHYYQHEHHQADGIYGPETADAIRSYQRAKGLPITGMIDAALFTAMGIAAPVYGTAAPMQGQAPAPGLAGGAGDVLTPAEAAGIMRVSEAEVVALLEKGALSGKQIGSSWRISRSAITEYLNRP
ncbi:MAG: peptidoglycan-binding protein [Prosthecobacter sp.]|uniref:peptidoglycan-binding protein n=1 Tax=Prosthecobacter sp. TaxID=1965333 RepID=UPI003BB08796